jgi:hypothetical protein
LFVHHTNLVLRVGNCVLANELQLNKLEQLIRVGDTLKDGAQVLESLIMADGNQSGESVSLAGSVTLGLEESLQKLRSIGHKGLVVLVDGSNGEDGILANI